MNMYIYNNGSHLARNENYNPKLNGSRHFINLIFMISHLEAITYKPSMNTTLYLLRYIKFIILRNEAIHKLNESKQEHSREKVRNLTLVSCWKTDKHRRIEAKPFTTQQQQHKSHAVLPPIQ